MYCQKCGALIGDDALFCSACGTATKKENTCKSIETCAKRKQNTKIKRIAIIAVVVLLVTILLIGALRKDGFEYIVENLPTDQQSLHRALGKPDEIDEKGFTIGSGNNKNYAVAEKYLDLNFLGRAGNLSVQYDGDDVTAVFGYWFSCFYSSDNPSESEQKAFQEYGDEIIEYFSEIYGEPNGQSAAGAYWSVPYGDDEFQLDSLYISVDKMLTEKIPIYVIITF